MNAKANSNRNHSFKVGDFVRLKATGEVGVVVDLIGADFVKVKFADGTKVVNAEALEPADDSPIDPIELLEQGALSDSRAYGLRLQAAYLQHAYQYDPKSGLSNARVEPKLHQVFAAHRVTGKLFPRMILADEVGLGKTIEAGLILKELRARQIIDRVLVVCPASLQRQWQYEMETKFNEEFEIYNRDTVKFLGRDGSNPWMKMKGVITSYSFAVRPKNMEQIVEADWDLIIFDEAHRVRRTRVGRQYRETKAYKMAKLLEDRVFGLLLLTATPMQLDPYELHSLIDLVDSSLNLSPVDFERKRIDIPNLNNMIKKLEEWLALSETERTSATHLLGLSIEDLNNDDQREQLISDLILQHPLAQVLIRNRKSSIGGFMGRAARRIPVKLTGEELELYIDISEYIRLGYDRANRERQNAIGFIMTTYQKLLTSSSYALRESFKKRVVNLNKQGSTRQEEPIEENRLNELRELDDISEELDRLEQDTIDNSERDSEIRELEGYIDRLGQIRDSKADKLVNEIVLPILDSNPDEKILIFTGFVNTQKFLQKIFQSVGYDVTVFNGQMDLSEKEKSVQRFRQQAQIMITTEAGGEGRNFQFAHIMVNYDLPWNPMKVEQRIGRLDRIGQTRKVEIYNLYSEDTLEERILDVLEYRIQLFTLSVGSLDPILGEVERDIARIVFEHMDNLDEYMERFGEDLEKQIAEAKLTEKKLGDFVLDRASFRQDEANKLLKRPTLASFDDLRRFIQDSLKYYGGMLSEHNDGGDYLTLSSQLARIIHAESTSVRGVFDPKEALEWEDLGFFAFGHKHIDQIVAYVYNQDVKTGVRCLSDAPPGVTVEIIYEYESRGPFHAKGQMVRHLIGQDLQIHSEMITTMPAIGQPVTAEADMPRWLPGAVERSQQRATEELQQFQENIYQEELPERREVEDRYRRVYAHRSEQLKARIDKQKVRINRITQHGTDDERRALPLRQNELQDMEQELRDLTPALQQKIEELNRQAYISQTIVSAGLVVRP